MTDRELLEAAARAAGIKILCDPHGAWRNCTGRDPAMNIFSASLWNPLTDDGDALRLAVKLEIHITNRGQFAWARTIGCDATEPMGSDPCAATRRAIVRVAAAMAPKG